MRNKLLPSLGLLAALITPLGAIFAQAPPPVPALPDTERRTQYSISGTTCACSVNFALYGDSTDVDEWIEVYIAGVPYKSTDSTHGWALTSATGTLATIPRPITDAVLTFNAVQTGTVQIVGARRPRRTVQVQEGQGVPARAFNQAVTDIIAQNRETWDRTNDIAGRTVRTPPGETMNTLPPLASRQGLGACFDSIGNLTACLTAPAGSISAGSGITFTGTGPTVISTATYSAGTGIGFTGSGPTVLSATNVPNSSLATMPANTIKCNNTSGSATPIDCTSAQAQALINGSSIAPPNNNNSEFLVWQKGTSFPGLTSGTVTSDHSNNGPGVGGTFTVQQSVLSAATRANFTTNPAPRFAKRLVWTSAPTGGEGRTGYTGYFSTDEERTDDVTVTYGQTITVSSWVWVDGGSSPFYLYAAQGMGVSGTSGLTGLGNTISGTGAGTDYSHAADEILYRSAQLTATTTPQLFTATFALNACASCAPQSDNTFEIGIGVDFPGVGPGEGLYMTLLKYDYGSNVLPWHPLPDATVYEAAQYNYQEWGVGTTCVVASSTTVTCYLPFRSVMKPVGPIFTLLQTGPAFTCGTGSASAIASSNTDQNGGFVVINGFTGLTPGSWCGYTGVGHFVSGTRQ